jgi:hypothetical protein
MRAPSRATGTHRPWKRRPHHWPITDLPFATAFESQDHEIAQRKTVPLADESSSVRKLT